MVNGSSGTLNEDLKLAMKARNARRVSTLRLVFAAIKDREIRAENPQNRR